MADLSSSQQAAWVIQKIGVRKTTLFGVVLNSLAVLLASFSTKSLGGLIFLQGIMAGIACGTLFMVGELNANLPDTSSYLTWQAVYPLPSQYFMRKRGIATGITCRFDSRNDVGEMLIATLLVSVWRRCWWRCMVFGMSAVHQSSPSPDIISIRRSFRSSLTSLVYHGHIDSWVGSAEFTFLGTCVTY